MPSLAKGLAAAGIASIRFDFDGHGKSEGRMQDMTVEKEIADARAVWEYARSTQELDIYGTASAYKGPVLLLHGSEDGIVPLRCSEEYLALYGNAAELKVIDGENHLISRRQKQVVAEAVAFFRRLLFEAATDGLTATR